MLKLVLKRFPSKFKVESWLKNISRPNTTSSVNGNTNTNSKTTTSQLSLANELNDRNLISQVTHNEVLPILGAGGQVVYFGIDPTESSLHLGHLLPIICIKHLVKYGNKAIIVIGGTTVKIGDPSGKAYERPMMEQVILNENYNKLEENIKQILKSLEIENDVTIMNNMNWYKDMKLLDFFDKVGRNARIGVMLDKWSVKDRINKGEGLSFQEFSYQLFQAYDFLHLYKTQGCRFQVGGGDQYGNITAGCDLVKKLTRKVVLGLTTPLLINREGEKIGKSDVSGNENSWISKDKASPYNLYQLMLRLDDKTAPNILRQLSLQPIETIKQSITKHDQSPQLRLPQKQLAKELTLLVYGEQGLKIADIGTRLSFESLVHIEDLTNSELYALLEALPHVKLPVQTDGKLSIQDVMVKSGHARSHSQASAMLVSTFRMNGKRFNSVDIEFNFDTHLLKDCLTMMKNGKKVTFIWWIRDKQSKDGTIGTRAAVNEESDN